MINGDICVIGAGSGGLSVAAGAAQLGLNVILIEKDDMGGDCLNTGCIPSKALLFMAKKGATFRAAHTHVKEVIRTIAPHDSQDRFEGLGCRVIRQPVHFIDKHTLETADGQKITANKFVIAAGARPFIPDIQGLKHNKILTNETIFKLEEKPSHLAILGGGPMGVEMAQAYARLGCQVTLLTRGSILPKDDPDCVAMIRQQLLNDGIVLRENTTVHAVTHGKTHTLKTDGDTVKATHILIATGRQPNIDMLNLKAAGVRHDEGGIVVNKRLRTNRRHIYALGDIIKDGPKFTHAAGYQAGIIIRNICFRLRSKVDYSALPWVTYTTPELAHIGMTEDRAIYKYGKKKTRVLTHHLAANDRAVTEGVTQGVIKVVGKTNGKILGVSIVADDAGEMMPIWSLAISKGLKMKDIAGLILPYPTIGEVHKSIAGSWYKDALFSRKTRMVVRFLHKLPSF